MLHNMRQQDRFKSTGSIERRSAKLLWREHSKASISSDFGKLLVVVDADSMATQVDEISANPAPYIKCETEVETAKVPTVRCLYIKPSLPPG
jgi:hypothetical protein